MGAKLGIYAPMIIQKYKLEKQIEELKQENQLLKQTFEVDNKNMDNEK